MVIFAGAGALRTLVLALRLDDGGLTRDLRRSGAGVSLFTRGVGNADRSLFALQTQLAITAVTAGVFTAAMGSAFASFEREITLGAIADGAEGAADRFKTLSAEALTLSRRFARSPQDMAVLIRSIQELGISTDASADSLARAAIQLGLIGGVPADEAAKTIFRLTRLTTRAGESFEDNLTQGAEGTANAILRVGQQTAAGTRGLEDFLRKFATIGLASRFSRAEVIALAGAFADLDESTREVSTSFIQTLFGSDIPERARAIAEAIGEPVEKLEDLRRDRPFELLLRLAQHFRRVEASGGNLAQEFRRLGIDQVRYIRQATALTAQVEILPRLLETASEATKDSSELNNQAAIVLDTTAERWNALKASVQRFAIAAGGTLKPLLVTLTGLLTGLADALERNRALAAAFAFGTLAVTIRSLRGLIATMGGASGLLGFAGLGGVAGGFRAGRLAVGAGGLGRTALGFSALDRALLAGGAAGGLAQPAGRLAGLGGGLLGALVPGGAGIAGRLATSSLGRFALMAGPIGLAVGLLALLGPMFASLGRALADAGKAGGLAGIAFKTLAIIMKIIETGANLLNKAFSLLLDAIKFGLKIVGDIIGVDIVGSINAGLDQIIGGLDTFNAGIAGTPAPEAGAAAAAAPAAQTNLYTSINLNEGGDVASRTVRDVAASHAFGLNRRSRVVVASG
jgi:hypothetical protein